MNPEYQDATHPIHKQSADDKRLLERHITELAERARLANPTASPGKTSKLASSRVVTARKR